jgi:hypothetical protein
LLTREDDADESESGRRFWVRSLVVRHGKGRPLPLSNVVSIDDRPERHRVAATGSSRSATHTGFGMDADAIAFPFAKHLGINML